MRYAFMSFSCPTATLPEMLDVARRLGYAGVEPRVESKHAHGIELGLSDAQVHDVLRMFARYEVALCCLAVGCRYANPETRSEEIDKTKRYIEFAHQLGCERLRVFGGKFPDETSRDQAIDNVASALVAVSPLAQQAGVTLCLETHDAWCDPDHVVEVMKRVDSPYVGVNWDILHTQRVAGAAPADAFAKLGPWVKHLHVHDADLSALPKFKKIRMGAGNIDHSAVLKLLKEAGYDGFLSGEWIASMMDEDFYNDHLAGEIEVLTRLEAQLS